MKVQNVQNQTAFKGYDARPLRGFFMSSSANGLSNDMEKIAKKEGFKLFSFKTDDNFKLLCDEGASLGMYHTLWSQDYWTIHEGKLFFKEKKNDVFVTTLKKYFNLNFSLEQLNKKKLTIKYFANKKKLLTEKTERQQRTDYKDFYEKRLLIKKEKTEKNSHIAGGNLFFIKGKKKDELIIGAKSVKTKNNPNGEYTIDEIKKMYNVQKVTVLPQMDYHLDLFIRPLDDKKILLADDVLTRKVLNQGLKKLKDYIKTLPEEQQAVYNKNVLSKMRETISKFSKYDMENNDLPQTDKIEKKLQKAGFKVFRVPGRIYNTSIMKKNNENKLETFLSHRCNFINANVLKNKDGDIVYITNKSLINSEMGLTSILSKKIGFSFEKSFEKALSGLVKPEHLYFVKGKNNFAQKMLTEYQGGIHCACMEVPM